MNRWPRSVYGSGTEPDPRFTLANERTFLAWIRTSGAMFALAFALDAFERHLTPWISTAIVVTLACGALVAAVESWRSWVRAERALRHREPLPSGSPNVLMAVLLVLSLVLFLIDVTVVQGIASRD